MFKRVIIGTAFLCFTLHRIAVAQPKINVTAFNSVNGLSQNTINCLFKDRYGFMWFGTQDGLNRYDGYTVTVYKHILNDNSSLPANHITAICEDKDGNLWVGTRTEGVSKYDRSHDRFINFQHDPSRAGSISSNAINRVYKDKRSNLWIGSANGLNLFEPTTGKFKVFKSTAKDATTLSDPNVTAIFEDDDQQLWVGTMNGLNQLNRATGKFTRYADQPVKGNVINSICEDDQHHLWLGTNKGLKKLGADGHFSYFAVDEDANSEDGVNPVFSVQKTKGNKFWLGTNTTLQLFDVDQKKLITINDKTVDDDLMPNDGIYSMLEDAGILWIGTSSQGILKYDKNLSLFPAFKTSLTHIPSAKNIIRGIAEDKAHNLYLATDVGLEYYDRASGASHVYVHSKSNTNSLLSNYTTAVVVSKIDASVWVGTYSSGLDHFDPKSRRFTHYTAARGRNQLNSNYIYSLLEDRKGNLWVGTDKGVNMIDGIGNSTRILVGPQNSTNSNAVQALCEDRNGNIWIGDYTDGISIFNPTTKTLSRITVKNSQLNSNVISAFYEDGQGHMWVGTMEGGLNCYDEQKKKFTAFYNEQNGLINNTINFITQDKDGFLWLTTNQGIIRFDVKENAFRNFNLYNGLKTMEFNLGAGCRLSNEELAFGSINGFNIVDPNRLNFNHGKPMVVLTGFDLFNKPVVDYSPSSPLKQTILTTKSITLNYDQSIFSIGFAALDYTIPSQNKYNYQLEGFDEEWRTVSNLRSATYTNLDPGTYLFKVRGSNNDGVWSRNTASLWVIIKPPYWMTWWFRSFALLLGSLVAYLAYRSRVRFLNKQQVELRKQVRERTYTLQLVNKELQEQTEELQVQSEEFQAQSEELLSKTLALEEINEELIVQKAQEERARQEADRANKAKSTFLATMSHEIRTPMNGVLGMASLLAETDLESEQREYTDAILTSGESLLNVINDVLDFSKIESGHMELDPHDFDLRKCIEDLLELFSSKTLHSGIELLYHIDEHIPSCIHADSFRLKQVLTNLISNAVKFTQKGEIVVSVVSVAGENDDDLRLTLTVRDTGIGIPEHQIKNLFEAFNQLDSSVTRKYGGSGLGLAICDRLIRLLGGTVSVKSEVGFGSSFSFDIRCRKGRELLKPLTGEVAIFTGKKILIVDDNPTNLLIFKSQLSKVKMEVHEAQSGERALAALETNKGIELIITDMQMPDMDGVALSHKIKALRPNIPIILLSSIGNETKKDHPGLFESVLTKPVRQQALYDVLEAVLQNKPTTDDVSRKIVLADDFAQRYPYRMLVAEDNLLNQKLMLRVLHKLGYQPDLANDGQEVLDKMASNTYDIILMDIQMPNVDGLQATRLVRQRYGPKPLILALTANAMSEDKDNCLEAGMNGYLSKPLKLELLVATLADFYKRL